MNALVGVGWRIGVRPGGTAGLRREEAPGGERTRVGGESAALGVSDAYGFVRYDASEVYDGMASRRRSGCLPAARGGDRRSRVLAESPGGTIVGRFAATGMLVWVMGGLLWKRQKMWKKLASSLAASTCSSAVSWPFSVLGVTKVCNVLRPSRESHMMWWYSSKLRVSRVVSSLRSLLALTSFLASITDSPRIWYNDEDSNWLSAAERAACLDRYFWSMSDEAISHGQWTG